MQSTISGKQIFCLGMVVTILLILSGILPALVVLPVAPLAIIEFSFGMLSILEFGRTGLILGTIAYVAGLVFCIFGGISALSGHEFTMQIGFTGCVMLGLAYLSLLIMCFDHMQKKRNSQVDTKDQI